MSARLGRLAVALYPLAFRRRYGDEMLALLDDAPPRAASLLDLLRGAVVAHVSPPAGLAGVVDADDRLRASASGVLACWVAFAAAGFGFYKTTEEGPFAAAGDAHPLLGVSHLAVQALAALASIAVVAGALPLIAAALRDAHRPRRLIASPVAAVMAFVALTALLVVIAQATPGSHAGAWGRAAFVAWGVAGLACGAVCVLAARAALFAVAVPRVRLRVALLCATFVTAAMVAMTLAVAVYAVALTQQAAGLAGQPDGPLAANSTAVSLVVQAAAMALTGGLAIITTLRGWRALREPDGSAHA